MKVYSETRPWGRFEQFHENKPCTVKMIYVSANSRLSLQYHDKRSEFWKVIKGTAMVELDGRAVILTEGETISMQEIFQYERQGMKDDGTIIGHFKPTGIRPKFADKLKTYGLHLPPYFFGRGLRP